MQFPHGKVKNLEVVDSNGKLIIKPVYQKISIPFPDRFLLYSGEVWDGIEFALCNITDNKGNAINSSFNLVEYKVFDDGNYIGIGTSTGKEASVPCYDENGNVREFGCGFIDKDGNTLSKRFDYFSCNIQDISFDGIFFATDAYGNAIEIKASDYICKP